MTVVWPTPMAAIWPGVVGLSETMVPSVAVQVAPAVTSRVDASEKTAVALRLAEVPLASCKSGGVTCTATTCALVTWTAAVPLLPFQLAVTVALPAARPATTPRGEAPPVTDATAGWLEVHVAWSVTSLTVPSP